MKFYSYEEALQYALQSIVELRDRVAYLEKSKEEDDALRRRSSESGPGSDGAVGRAELDKALAEQNERYEELLAKYESLKSERDELLDKVSEMESESKESEGSNDGYNARLRSMNAEYLKCVSSLYNRVLKIGSQADVVFAENCIEKLSGGLEPLGAHLIFYRRGDRSPDHFGEAITVESTFPPEKPEDKLTVKKCSAIGCRFDDADIDMIPVKISIFMDSRRFRPPARSAQSRGTSDRGRSR